MYTTRGIVVQLTDVHCTPTGSTGRAIIGSRNPLVQEEVQSRARIKAQVYV